MNIKTMAARRENMLWFRVPNKIYFKLGAMEPALKEYSDRRRACIITDKTMEQLGHVRKVEEVLERMGIEVRVFSGVLPDPDLATVRKALDMVNAFQPDMFIALGGGSPMDAAKIIWLLYEKPDTRFEDIALRFMDIRKRVVSFPDLAKKLLWWPFPQLPGQAAK